eukprot:364621-Chlamydomonas_euryale.AAC.2
MRAENGAGLCLGASRMVSPDAKHFSLRCPLTSALEPGWCRALCGSLPSRAVRAEDGAEPCANPCLHALCVLRMVVSLVVPSLVVQSLAFTRRAC